MIPPRKIEQLVRQHAPALELFASGWSPAPEDCVQEAFIELANLASPPVNPSAWLFRVVRNKAISEIRAGKRRRQREDVAGRARLQAVESSSQSHEAVQADDVAAALAQLSAEQREVVVAKVWGGLTFAQIAESFEISTSAAHRRYQAGLESLRFKLGLQWISQTQ